MHLDDVPAGAAEDRFELLDDLAVAADRTVEPLQVAVDDEDQVVELLARGQRDRAERFRLVGFAVAEERPDLRVRPVLEAAIFQVAHEARLIDRQIGPRPIDTVGNSQKSGISQGCGYDERPPPSAQLAAEVVELLRRQPAFEERAGVDAGRRVALEIDDVAVVALALAAEEVVEPDFVERGGGGERRDVAADALFDLVGLDDHRQRIPAHEALDAALDLAAAGKRRLLVGGDGVDVGGVRGEWLPTPWRRA